MTQQLKTNMEIKKPYAVVQYNKFIKGVDRADQYLSCYSVLRKTVKWWKKGCTVSAELCALQHFFVYRTLNTNTVTTRTSCTRWDGPGYQNSKIEVSQVLMTNCQRRGPKQYPPGRLSGDFRIHKLEKNCLWWGGKKEVSCKTVYSVCCT